ncbi:hypothetical protein J6590_103763 [Homalodisca vitripennis]|nr:hypothetical protein J6590_103763 [Homalodisca vitripennis]
MTSPDTTSLPSTDTKLRMSTFHYTHTHSTKGPTEARLELQRGERGGTHKSYSPGVPTQAGTARKTQFLQGVTYHNKNRIHYKITVVKDGTHTTTITSHIHCSTDTECSVQRFRPSVLRRYPPPAPRYPLQRPISLPSRARPIGGLDVTLASRAHSSRWRSAHISAFLIRKMFNRGLSPLRVRGPDAIYSRVTAISGLLPLVCANSSLDLTAVTRQSGQLSGARSQHHN